MKRIICLFCALLLLFLSACGETEVEPSEEPSETVSEPATPEPTPDPLPTPAPIVNPLTGLPTETDLSGQRPMAIMLNNLKAAMPQQGNSQADIIYEVLAEGGITRMLGVYQDVSDLGLVGSIRSARQYYWELSQGHDALYIHAGGSPEFYSTKSSLGLTTVDGVNGYWPGMFWRDRNRIEGKRYAVEHSLLSSGEAITDMLGSHPDLVPHTEGFVASLAFVDDGTPADGQPATTVTVSFASSKSTIFHYDEENKLYQVEEYGEPYIDGNSGAQVAVTNVLALQTTCSMVSNDDKGRITVDLSSGDGWFACGGKIVPITWKKGGPNDQLQYFTADGQPLSLGRGKSYVCIFPIGRTLTAE